MLIDAANLTALREAMNKRFQAGFSTAPSFWQQIAMLVPSTTAIETYAWMADIPGFEEWVGERTIHNLKSRAAQVINRKFQDAIKIPREKLEDDQFGIYGNWAEMMGVAARTLPDELLATLIKAADTTVCWDGQYFFDTDHPVSMDDSASGTQANAFTSSALSATTYATVRAAMFAFKGEGGRYMNVRPNLLVVPPQLEKTAKEVVVAQTIPGAAIAGDNVMRGTADVLVIPHLADEPTRWYLFDTTKPIKPFVWQERQAVEFTAKFNPTDDNVFFNDEYIFGGRMRGEAAHGLWFLAATAIA